LHARMGYVLEVVRYCAVCQPRRGHGCDRHPASAMRTGEENTRQVRRIRAFEMHGALPVDFICR
jgi:hypothetical protein